MVLRLTQYIKYEKRGCPKSKTASFTFVIVTKTSYLSVANKQQKQWQR
jgi:hypothetical protein